MFFCFFSNDQLQFVLKWPYDFSQIHRSYNSLDIITDFFPPWHSVCCFWVVSAFVVVVTLTHSVVSVVVFDWDHLTLSPLKFLSSNKGIVCFSKDYIDSFRNRVLPIILYYVWFKGVTQRLKNFIFPPPSKHCHAVKHSMRALAVLAVVNSLIERINMVTHCSDLTQDLLLSRGRCVSC